MKSILHLSSVAHRHADTEADGNLDGILATLEGEPVYEFYPLGRRFRGMANTRRYYEHFISTVRPRVIGAVLHNEAIGPGGVVQEYTVTARSDEDQPPSAHRVMAILTFGSERLSGDRMFSDERFFRLLIGPLWEELEIVP